MAKLRTDQQRRFVWAMLCTGGDGAEAARMAGASDHLDAAKVYACRSMQNPAIVEALREVTTSQFEASALMAAGVLIEIAQDKTKKAKDRLNAAEAILNRTGFSPVQTFNVNKTVTDLRGDALLERLRVVAGVLGVDVGRLIGEDVSQPAPGLTRGETAVHEKVIEHQPK
jgi:hypothetical protein